MLSGNLLGLAITGTPEAVANNSGFSPFVNVKGSYTQSDGKMNYYYCCIRVSENMMLQV